MSGNTASSSPNVRWHPSDFDRQERWDKIGAKGATIWFTGFSGSGKSTVAVQVERLLLESGQPTYLLDGDNLRMGLNGDLGFSAEDRDENVRRVSEVARLFADAGVVSLVPLVSPYRAARDTARDIHGAADLPFIECYISTPIEVCESRDPKGLYKKARAGEIKGMTGIDDPYEPPLNPELVLDTTTGSAVELAQKVLDYLNQ